jgi:hypothetical protein
MPGATWRPVPNCTKGGQEQVLGVVLHIMEGTLAGSDSWFRNASSQASAHFGVGKDGRIYQWVDTADRAWAQSAGNRTWLSIEHEGHSGDALTAAQLAATARIVAWAHTTHGVPLQLADAPTGRGIGWHGMGGADWGGHYDCPGNPIKNQRAAIITAAKSGAPTVQEDDMPTPEEYAEAVYKRFTQTGAVFGPIDNPTTTDDKTIGPRPLLWEIGKDAFQANNAAQKGLAQIGGLAGAVAALAQNGGLPLAQVQAAAEAGADAALAKLGETLTSTPKES